MLDHRTQVRNKPNSLISGLLKRRPKTYPHLCLALRNLILHEASKDAHQDFTRLPEIISEVKDHLNFYSVDRETTYDRVAGVDAGSHRVPLASRWFAVITALIYQLPEAKRYFTAPEAIKLPYSVSSEKFQEIVSVRRETKLFETSARYLMKNEGLDLMLIDGPLAFSNWWIRKGGSQDRLALISSINLLLNLCAERGVAVAGVVKRVTARYLIRYLGLQEKTPLSDAFVLLQILKSGERTAVFSPRSSLKKTVRGAPFMDLLDCPIYSFYMRTCSDRLLPPVRLDVPAFMLNQVDKLAGYCYSTAVREGIPLPIVRADEEV
ncbi:DNA double-strand break repair nuclease NurA, partial [Candidatus Bathyarchaeota archaeon]|nr:DNA double-strand break repair nuclease NurA [Candidatus Bathyarchaeota archaeon]NIV67370.1 DNA double-strand break repair nuclease NurA [Candidatus Bathyarchaeota archaeon]NIW15914.1 DNA double-strand break repair nuclease NurA [Candidatus Bathyarchaeota archaeon]NIW34016.1 DNA double-strand break repair nuclease NurA [Candidatus Bathyarchaeota archaeon]